MKELLPIGSVVLLKESNKRIMIYGRFQKQANEEGTLWDYVGCLYPEGNISPEASILFNHEQIEMVYFIGFQDQEEFEYKNHLIRRYEELTN